MSNEAATAKQTHSPRLNTIIMVEETIKNAKSSMSVAGLKKALPKQVNHITLKAILKYLEASGKIAVALDGISWAKGQGPASGTPIAKITITPQSILKKLSDNRSTMEKYHVKSIGLFGSFARGEARADSDIDILVKFTEGDETFDNYMDLKFFLERLLGREVDLVMKEAVKPPLKDEILNSVLYAT